MEEFTSFPCLRCGGPWHEATGHVLDSKSMAVLCGPCTRLTFTWVKLHINKKAKRKKGHVQGGKKGPDFYTEAATSVRARN